MAAHHAAMPTNRKSHIYYRTSHDDYPLIWKRGSSQLNFKASTSCSPRNPGSRSSSSSSPRQKKNFAGWCWRYGSRQRISPAAAAILFCHLLRWLGLICRSLALHRTANRHCPFGAVPASGGDPDASWSWGSPALKMVGRSMCSHGRGFLGEFLGWVIGWVHMCRGYVELLALGTRGEICADGMLQCKQPAGRASAS
jgi:hypothetical protein